MLETNAGRLRPSDVRAYAEQHGWLRSKNFKDRLAIYRHADRALDQLLVPLNDTIADYADRMRDVLCKLAEIENRPPAAILNDLLAINVDTVRFSVRSADTAGGTLPLQSGLGLLEGARRSLLSAACTVLAPNTFWHARMSRTQAEEFVDACQLGQTEQGSFTVTIRCPLTIGEDDETATIESEPFGRRATSTLMRSAAVLTSAIDNDQVDVLTQGPARDEPNITANLCDALLRMQPGDAQSSLALSVSWAPARPRPPSDTVILRSDHFPRIDWLYRRLRPIPTPHAAPVVGQVDELRGVIGSDGRRQGEIRLSVLCEDELVKAKADLSADQYQIASDAHMNGDTVVVAGILERRPRLSLLRDIGRFERLAPENAHLLPRESEASGL